MIWTRFSTRKRICGLMAVVLVACGNCGCKAQIVQRQVRPESISSLICLLASNGWFERNDIYFLFDKVPSASATIELRRVQETNVEVPGAKMANARFGGNGTLEYFSATVSSAEIDVLENREIAERVNAIDLLLRRPGFTEYFSAPFRMSLRRTRAGLFRCRMVDFPMTTGGSSIFDVDIMKRVIKASGGK